MLKVNGTLTPPAQQGEPHMKGFLPLRTEGAIPPARQELSHVKGLPLRSCLDKVVLHSAEQLKLASHLGGYEKYMQNQIKRRKPFK